MPENGGEQAELSSVLCDACSHMSAPRILILHGSCRNGSLSLKLGEVARAELLRLGAEVQMFDPAGLPLAGNAAVGDPKLEELHRKVAWSQGQVWCSPEHHGSLSGVMKLILDCFPSSHGDSGGANGRTLALMQVAGGAISCNALNDMQRIGRSLGMNVALGQVSIGEAGKQFNAQGGLLREDLARRLAVSMTELLTLTLLHRDGGTWLRDMLACNRQIATRLTAAA